MQGYLKPVIVVSALLTVVCFWNRNSLPANYEPVAGLEFEPQQTPLRLEPISTEFNGVDYKITPRFNYEMTGLVVSFRYHDSESRLHRLSNDHLNMLDVCVVWGKTARSPFLSKIDIWNGVFTCNLQTRDRQAWDSISMEEVSNNHLISDNLALRDSVSGLRVGDQIRVRGYLADYQANGAVPRVSSITRSDQGNGACETIYVTYFERLAPGSSPWRMGFYVSFAVLLFALLFYLLSPHRARELNY
ncbi:MAG: hypothetical protein AAF385_17550 [Pseudomonadota bacterium]